MGDLYAVLGVPPHASAADLRRAYTWVTGTRQSPERRNAVQAAYAVLGDPRLRAEYDAGRVVGLGAGVYHRRGTTSARQSATPTVLPGRVGTLESRWHDRQSRRPDCQPTGRGLLTALSVGLIGAALAAGMQHVSQPAAQAAVTAFAPPAVTYVPGTCLSGAGHLVDPGTRRPCSQPHQLEVIGISEVGPAAAEDVCTQEFRSYTGLAAPTPDLFPTTVQEATRSVCLIASRYLRTTTARGIAG